MVIDTSALLAILFNEPDAEHFELALATDPVRLMSAASVLEAAIVVEARLGEAGGRALDELLSTAQVTIMPVTTEHAAIARQAYRTYGKGRHPAGLNYGDCFSSPECGDTLIAPIPPGAAHTPVGGRPGVES